MASKEVEKPTAVNAKVELLLGTGWVFDFRYILQGDEGTCNHESLVLTVSVVMSMMAMMMVVMVVMVEMRIVMTVMMAVMMWVVERWVGNDHSGCCPTRIPMMMTRVIVVVVSTVVVVVALVVAHSADSVCSATATKTMAESSIQRL